MTFVDYFFNDFAHQVIGNIYRMFLEHITENITQRFESKIMGTYHRAIATLKNNSPEIQKNIKLPAICVDPVFPINIEEKSKQLWRMPIATSFSKKLYKAIYQDDNIRITPGFVRYESPISVYCWFDFIYEFIDTQLRFIQAFHSDKWSKPFGMEVYCPIPQKVYTYDNPDGIVINWPPEYIPRLLDTINADIPMMPMYLSPLVKMTSISSISNLDADSGEELGTCALQADFMLEFEVPTFYLVESFWQIRKLECVMSVSVPTNVVFVKTINLQDDPDESTDPDHGIIVPDHVVPSTYSDFSPENIKQWILIEIDENTSNPISVEIDSSISDPRFIVFKSMIIIDTYSFDDANHTLEITLTNKQLQERGVVNIIVY